jgi:hypothetical protein
MAAQFRSRAHVSGLPLGRDDALVWAHYSITCVCYLLESDRCATKPHTCYVRCRRFGYKLKLPNHRCPEPTFIGHQISRHVRNIAKLQPTALVPWLPVHGCAATSAVSVAIGDGRVRMASFDCRQLTDINGNAVKLLVDFAKAQVRHGHRVSHSGLLEPRGTSTVLKDPGVFDRTTWSVMP